MEKTSETEKRGPVEKGEKGWPVNPFGVFTLVVFIVLIAVLIVRPIVSKKTTIIQQDQQQNTAGGRIESPRAGEIITESNKTIVLQVDDPSSVQKVEFWAKIYSLNKWEKIGEDDTSPYELDWQIPSLYQNKALAITSHIYEKNGEVVKDPGGWREGIIILPK